MKSVELLAPAGNFECAIAGFTYGADAIYLGLKNFSARADAFNFSNDELIAIVNFAHKNNKKVYVAINTLIQNDEIDELIEKLYWVDKANADAVIVQDFGVVNIIKTYFPNIQLHASTQMAVHNLDGAIALKNLGFSRCVLARELSFDEILYITKNCGIETEVFIHGALCYSYSGLCMYSSFIKGESANRGKCTYPCRKLYDGVHPYSMKDLCLSDDVKKLCEIGVASLKIEGRKKTPLYVASTTDYYRKIIDGKNTKGLIENIKRIFARPFTNLHFYGKNKDVIDRDFSGPRGLFIGKVLSYKNNSIKFKTLFPIAKHDGLLITIENVEKPFGFALDNMRVKGKYVFEANKGDIAEVKLPKNSPMIKENYDVYCASSMSVKGSYPYNVPSIDSLLEKEKIDITCILTKNNISAFSIYNNQKVAVQIDGDFQKANDIEKMKISTFNAFSKLGDSSFILNDFNYQNDDGIFASISILNDIRRQLIVKLEALKSNIKPILPNVKKFDDVINKSSNYIIKIDDASYLDLFDKNDIQNIYEVIIDVFNDIEKLNPLIDKNKVRISIPVVIRDKMILKVKEKIKYLINKGFYKFQISNIFGLNIVKEFNITDWSVDYFMYNLNLYAFDFWKNLGAKRITLSVEDNKKNMNLSLKKNANISEVIVYQDTPLFIADNCMGDCKNCKSSASTIIKNCRNFILSPKPFCIVEYEKELIAPFAFRFDFCFKKYNAQEVKNLFNNLMKNKKPLSYTIANFDRGFK